MEERNKGIIEKAEKMGEEEEEVRKKEEEEREGKEGGKGREE